jgi:hypothetical protein
MGVCSVLVMCLEAHTDIASVVTSTSSCVNSLVRVNKDIKYKTLCILGMFMTDARLENALTDSLKYHSGDLVVFSDICNTLSALSTGDSVFLVGIDIYCQLVAALMSNIDDSFLAMRACSAICNLASVSPCISEALGAAEACEAVLLLLKVQSTDQDMIDIATKTLKNLTSESHRNCAIVRNNNGLQELVEMLYTQHTTSAAAADIM